MSNNTINQFLEIFLFLKEYSAFSINDITVSDDGNLLIVGYFDSGYDDYIDERFPLSIFTKPKQEWRHQKEMYDKMVKDIRDAANPFIPKLTILRHIETLLPLTGNIKLLNLHYNVTLNNLETISSIF